MDVQLQSGKNVIGVQSLNVTLNRGDNWTKIQKIDFGSANVTFTGPTSTGSSAHTQTCESTALTECTNGKFANTNTSFMFSGCTKLTNVTTQATASTNSSYMFRNCKKLTTVNLGSMNAVTNGIYMFSGCNALTSVTVGNMSNLLSGTYLFHSCSSLTSVSIKPSKVKDMKDGFADCFSLASISLGTLSALTNCQYMFRNCSALTSIAKSNIDVPVVQNGYGMYSGCASITVFQQNVYSALTNGNGMFCNCTNLTTINSNMISVPVLSNGNRMFYNCSKFKFNCIGDWRTEGGVQVCHTDISVMDGMFYNCQNLLGVYGFIVSGVSSMTNTFYNCKKCYIFGIDGINCDIDLSYTRLGRASDTDDTFTLYYIRYLVQNAKSGTYTLTVPKWLESQTNAVAQFNALKEKGWTVKYVER